MNKVLSMVLSGALIALMSSSWAMNQSEMEVSVSAQTGFSNTQAHNALDAFEKQLKEEMAAKRAVKFDRFGQFNPREMAGIRTGHNPRTGGQLQYESWKLVKKPEVIDEALFNARAAVRAGMSVEDYDKALEAYKSSVGSVLQRGGSVAMHGEGTYAVGRVAARTYHRKDGSISMVVPRHRKVKYSGYGGSNKQQFKADVALTCKLNGGGCPISAPIN